MRLGRTVSSTQDSLIVIWWRDIDYLNTIILPVARLLDCTREVHPSVICHHFICNWLCLVTGACWVLGYRMQSCVLGSHTQTNYLWGEAEISVSRSELWKGARTCDVGLGERFPGLGESGKNPRELISWIENSGLKMASCRVQWRTPVVSVTQEAETGG